MPSPHRQSHSILREELARTPPRRPACRHHRPVGLESPRSPRARRFDVVLTDLKMPRRAASTSCARSGPDGRAPSSSWSPASRRRDRARGDEARGVRLRAKAVRIDQSRETFALVEQERESESSTDGQRDPAREAPALAASGQHEVLFLRPRPGPPPPYREPLDPRIRSAYRARRDVRHRVPTGGRPSEGRTATRAPSARGCRRHSTASPAPFGHGPLRVRFNPRRSSGIERCRRSAASSRRNRPTRRSRRSQTQSGARRCAGWPTAQPSFREAMTAAGLDDSPKTAFHLRKLVERRFDPPRSGDLPARGPRARRRCGSSPARRSFRRLRGGEP